MEDQDLIALYQAHSEEALVETARLYGPYCCCIAYQFLHNQQDVEECFNDILLKCWETIPEHPPTNLRGYIAAMARNMAISKYRCKKRWDKCLDLSDSVSMGLQSQTNCFAESLCSTYVILECIEELLHHQSPENREIFTRRYLKQQDIGTIAQACSLSEGCVKTRLFRMRGALKQLLLQNGIYLD